VEPLLANVIIYDTKSAKDYLSDNDGKAENEKSQLRVRVFLRCS